MARKVRNITGAATAAVAVMIAGSGVASAHEDHMKAVKPFVTNSIVTQKSIGGFKLDESPKTVRKHFPKKDCTAYACHYAGSGYEVQVQFGSRPNSTKSSVDFISLSSTTGKDAAVKVRTASGVHLGSTYAQSKKGLKHAKYAGTKQSGYFYFGKGNVGSTDTIVYITKGVVNLIDIQRIDHVG